MHEIKCPNCQKVFQMEDSSYIEILEQIRNTGFSEEVEKRLHIMSENMALTHKNAMIEKDAEIQRLTLLTDYEKQQSELERKSLVERYETEKRLLNEELDRYKDFKLRLSTKSVGESLEQFCSDEFEKLRMAAFPNAEFGKDNDASSGSKGDFIYREVSDGVEFVSIMFEMKNENEETATKHKNEDFLKELDKDRKEKKCEYAVLVSMLEKDSELYNTGIVDVSHKYSKMYVIRPQFFISMITLLRNAALNTLEYKKKMLEMQQEQIEVEHFEATLDTFKEYVTNKYTAAQKKNKDAIELIDKIIKNMQDLKTKLEGEEKDLRLVDEKMSGLTIKKLKKQAPEIVTMIEMAAERKNGINE